MEDPVKKTISEKWVTATGSMGAPTAGIIDQHGKLVWIGYPDVAKGYTFDQALEDTLAGKIDLAQSLALQIKLSQETANIGPASPTNRHRFKFTFPARNRSVASGSLG